jgi:hypothetical protein
VIGATLTISSTGQLVTLLSSQRYKREIRVLDAERAKLSLRAR